MPSAFGHAIFAASLSPFRPYHGKLLPTLLISMTCATIPDLDVIGFDFGIRYSDMMGHRGFTHSLLFALLTGMIVTRLFFKEESNTNVAFFTNSMFYFLCTASHGVLDAMTDGGLGVGFFIPFSNERHFFSFRPIPVSSLNISSFFSETGWRILKQELLFVGIISGFLVMAGYFWRKRFLETE
jgi:inner membrane protein